MARILLSIIIAVHGLIHLMGFVTYLDLGEVENLDVTSVLVSRGDIPDGVSAVIGVAWLLVAVGFVGLAAGVVLRNGWVRPAVISLVVVSAVLSIMALPDAVAGIPINLVVLAGTLVASAVDTQNRFAAQLQKKLEKSGGGPFEPSMTDGLPEPVRRYLLHAIAPGTALAQTVTLEQTGTIRAGGRTLGFEATQTLTPGLGLLWTARSSVKGVLLTARDHYFANDGRMRVALLDTFPVVNAHGDDIARSGRGRLAIERVWLPVALLPQNGTEWSAQDESHITARFEIDGDPFDLELTIGQQGELQQAEIQRWGDPANTGSSTFHPYGGKVTVEGTFDGMTIPTALSIGWQFGQPDFEESISMQVEEATFS